jgi:dipeptidase E
MKRHLLLISNSTNFGEEYLGWPRQHIVDFMKNTGITRILFLPYAGISLSPENVKASYDVYVQKVKEVFHTMDLEIVSIHKEKDPVMAVKKADAIAVGGGNTFHLVYMMHRMNIMDIIRRRVQEGMHYMGWSAGANVACPGLFTTNDMPVIEPESFSCLNLIPFQINPHYLDANPAGHGGETREQRIYEYTVLNRDRYVAGLRESTLLVVNDDDITLKGIRPMRVFKYGLEPREYEPDEDITFLLK